MSSYRVSVEQLPARKDIVGYAFDEATVTARELRSWPDDKLHIISAIDEIGPAAGSMIEAEKRRREAWRSPAGAAFWISCAALLVSLAALVLSAVQRFAT